MGSSAKLPGTDSWFGHVPGLCCVWLGHGRGWDLLQQSVEKTARDDTCSAQGSGNHDHSEHNSYFSICVWFAFWGPLWRVR